MSEEVIETTVETTDAVVKTRKPRAKSGSEDTIVTPQVVEAQETTTDEGQEVITGPKRGRAPRSSNMHSKKDGTIGSHAADRALDKVEVNEVVPKEKVEKVALWSSKNARWSGVGEVSKGYNIVTKEAAEQWLTKAGIREATPEEVAAHYGK